MDDKCLNISTGGLYNVELKSIYMNNILNVFTLYVDHIFYEFGFSKVQNLCLFQAWIILENIIMLDWTQITNQRSWRSRIMQVN